MKFENIDEQVEYLYNRMFTKYYSGDELYGWQRLTFFGGGNSETYKWNLKKLLDEGKRVKTGYNTSKRVRGSKTYYIFFK